MKKKHLTTTNQYPGHPTSSLYYILSMTYTSQSVSNVLKVSLVLEGLKFQGDISKSTRVTPDFNRLKGEMTLDLIGTVVSCLEQVQDN